MAETNFKVQKGIIVSDGNLVVSNPSGSSGTDAVVYAKEFNTHGSSTLTTAGLDIRENTILATAESGTSDLDINITPKGTGEVNISKVDIDGGTIDGVAITGTSATFTSLSLSDGNITNVGDINADSISVDAAGTGLNINMSGANTGTAKITLRDDMADALNILENTNSYMKFITTNSSEQIVFGQNSTFASTTIADLGTVTTANIDGGSIDGTAIGASAQSTAKVTTLQTTSHAKINGSARDSNTLLQINGSARAGSANSDTGNMYSELRLYSDIANDDLAGSWNGYFGMSNSVILENAEAVTTSGQAIVFSVGTGTNTGSTFAAGRMSGTADTFTIGYFADNYDEIGYADGSAQNSENPMLLANSIFHVQPNGIVTIHKNNGQLVFTSNNDKTTAIKGNSGATANVTYTLPVAGAASNGYVLSATTTGAMSWVAQSGGIALDSLSVNTPTASGGGALAYNNTNGEFTYTPPLNITGNAGTVTVADESSEAVCFPLFATAASGTLAPKTGTNLAFNSNTGQLTQTGASTGAIGLVLKNTATSSGNVTGQELRFVTERSGSQAGQDNDDLGLIRWYGNDSAGNNQDFGMIKVRTADVTSGAEKGSMQFAVATSGNSGGIENVLTITGGTAAATSTVTIAGNLVVNGQTTTIDTTQLVVEDDLITISKGNTSLANANGAGLEIECTDGGVTNPSFTYQSTPDAFEANTHLNLASGKSYKINDLSILSATTIASSVTSAAGLATVGTITTGVWNGTAITNANVAEDLTISGGTIDNTTIGVTTATTGQFTQVGVGTSADVVSVIETNALTSQSWTGGSAYMIEEYLYATYRTVKYVGQVSDGTNVDAFEVLVTYKGASEPADNNAIFMTTYAYIASNSDTPLGTVSAVKSGSGGTGKIQLKFTPTSNGTFKSAVTATQVIKQ